MATVYTDKPHNFSEIASWVITEPSEITTRIYQSKTCFFYDTCSFRKHANMNSQAVNFILEYFKIHDGMVIITRCILMELASKSGCLIPEYIQYIKQMRQADIDVVIMYEEDIFTVLSMCFSTNLAINNYLIWAVRMLKNPAGTIKVTLNEHKRLKTEVLEGKDIDNNSLYKRFFEAVRNNKVTDDDLGEELLAICLHILSHIPGEADGKYCIITEDKCAAGQISMLFKNTATQYKGSKIIIYSTPKLVQYIYREGILSEKSYINEILSAGQNGNIRILGTQKFDLNSKEISLSCEELTELIMIPNGIHITF